MQTVYWMNLQAGSGCSLEDKFSRLLKKAGMLNVVSGGDITAIKVHVGQEGNLGYLNHNYARLAAGLIASCGARPFLSDTNTLYSGGRHNAVDHHHTAAIHGYSLATAGAPFIVADGLRGLDFEELPVAGGKHFTNAKIGSALCQADKLVMLSHFKGHGEMGFGGTLKNLGMGCAAVPGKLELHSSVKPCLNSEQCTACGQCVRTCPEKAVVLTSKKAVINYNTCIGCGQCVAACNYGAINVRWESHGEVLIEKVGEYAAAVHNRFASKALYVNFAVSISPDCDCWDFNDVPIVHDVGIFASTNPCALDRATLDCINKAAVAAGGSSGKKTAGVVNIFDRIHPNAHSEYLFEYCRKLGIPDAYELEMIV